MEPAKLRATLEAIPEVSPRESDDVARAIDDEVAYLDSDEAIASLGRDTYWPKWRSPWWSMVLLDELGLAARIPARAVTAMVDGLNALPVKTFPLVDADWPPGADRARDSSCHCALGAIDRVLTRRGVDVAQALPWTTPWYPRYQLADGGYNCDEAAYAVTDECPSSMVGTVAPLEALTGRGPSEVAARAAAMLLGRALAAGSSTKHNADERTSASHWGALTFPRFYFYDVLRGLSAVVAWATAHGGALPLAAVAPTALGLAGAAPDGVLRVERRAFADKTTWASDDGARWTRQPARTWPLLEAVSVLGAPSPALTRQWTETRRALVALLDAGRVTA